MIQKRKIGAHVSVAGDFSSSLFEAERIGANTIQIFGASPVRWGAPLPEEKEAEKFRELCQKMDIGPVFLHAPYLINLASPKGNMPQLSQALLLKHLEIANVLGAKGVIFHVGSRGERGEDEAIKMVADSITEILNQTKEGFLLMENSAGAGNLVGDSLREMTLVSDKVGNNRLGFCLDTAHAFESGMIADFSQKGLDEFFSQFDSLIGLDKIMAIHLNDSKTPLGSNKDRHENIGKGMIGLDNIKEFINRKEIKDVPLILEVPGFDDDGPDKKNIDIVKSILN